MRQAGRTLPPVLEIVIARLVFGRWIVLGTTAGPIVLLAPPAGRVIVRLTVVLFVAASLVGTIPAVGAAPSDGTVARAPGFGSVIFDDQVVPAGCGCCDRPEVCDEGGDA